MEWPKPHPEPVDPAEGTVVIVGRGRDQDFLTWGEEGHEYWGLNDLPSYDDCAPLRCYNRWFQLHPPKYLSVHYPRGLEDLEDMWGEERGVTLYMDRHYPDYPDSVPYPKAEVEALTVRGDYHVSSLDWMVALAVLEGWSRIVLQDVTFFTFPLTLNGEPVSARACLEYWVGVAEGRGIEVVMHSFGGDLFKNVHVAVYRSDLQYGFEREPALDLGLSDERWSDVR